MSTIRKLSIVCTEHYTCESHQLGDVDAGVELTGCGGGRFHLGFHLSGLNSFYSF